MKDVDRLPQDAIDLIICADTVFLGTAYNASLGDEESYPSHVGMNQRGGRAGFIRVLPSDGRTVVLPDYSGWNRSTHILFAAILTTIYAFWCV